MLGYSPYLLDLICALKGSEFLTNNQIDIAFPLAKLNVPKKLFTVAKAKLTADEFKAFQDDFERDYGEAEREQIIQEAFPDGSLSFLKEYNNVCIKQYKSLARDWLVDYDYMIVASFGEKIPHEIFSAPKYGTLNVHPSLLPDLRGGYPTYIQAFDPTQQLGITIHEMSEGFDKGNIVIQERYETNQRLSNSQLLSLSASYAAELLNVLYKTGFQLTPVKQEQARATECRKVLKRKSYVARMKTAADFEGFVSANHDRYLFPYTYTFLAGELFMILGIQALPANQTRANQWPDGQIQRSEGQYYIKFGSQAYLICEYIFRGQFHKR